jgi:crotonobetainyl-CoA:carnitine CoA-transferase CaiB-like acyl-CoA transferase
MNANRNKRSVVLDLKKDAGRAACLAIAKKRRCPHLQHPAAGHGAPQAVVRGGSRGQRAHHLRRRLRLLAARALRGESRLRRPDPGRDRAALAAKEAGAETPRYVPATLADRSVGLHIVNAVCAALYWREKSGSGQRVDVPMFESLLQTVMGEHMGGYTYLPQHGRAGLRAHARQGAPPYETKDGYVCVLVYNDKQWRAFFELIGRPGADG